MKVIVYHGLYGCDTGCCGHYVELCSDHDEITEWGADNPIKSAFDFGHPWKDEDLKEYARNLVTEKFGEEHCADLDWDNCQIVTEDCC